MMVNTTRNQCLSKLNIALNVLLQELTLEYDSDSLIIFHVFSSSQLSSLPLVHLNMYFFLY